MHYCLFKERVHKVKRNKWTKAKAVMSRTRKMEKLWLVNQPGDHYPKDPICTLWLNNTMHFAWWARDKHRNILMGDMKLQRDTERDYSTRSDVNKLGTERCPVKFFKIYLALQPPQWKSQTSHFTWQSWKTPKFLAWTRYPPGAQSLGNFMKNDGCLGKSCAKAFKPLCWPYNNKPL